jgi:DNA-binding transcriptional LysR family regulator
MDDLPRLFEHLMAFVAVVDAGGFNAAGNRFGVPPSRLSRSVAALEGTWARACWCARRAGSR